MFWDGERWLPDAPAQPTPVRRSWGARTIAALVVGLFVAGGLVPFGSTPASATSGRALIREWSAEATVKTLQETSSRISYKGKWYTAMYPTYLGGKVRSTDRAGAKATLRFTGSAISWIGSKGPTRGKASVYIDGKLVATANTWARSFKPTQVIFKRTWTKVGEHRITIVAKGTRGHPTVAIDAFVIRVGAATEARKVRPPAEVKPRQSAAPDAAAADASPSPAVDPTPVVAEPAPSDSTPAEGAPSPSASTAAPVDPTPVPTATPRPTATPTPTPAPTATPATSVRVSSITALLNALADNTVTEIVVANGTYRVSAAASQASNSLWIGKRYASRTRAVTVRAETRGGVTFDGGGATYFGGISFEEGAHHQTWDGFVFANGTPTSTGVVTFGGYNDGSAAAHHITMRNLRFLSSIRGSVPQDHDIYISATSPGTGGVHDLLFEDITADGSGGIMSAFNFGHSWGDNAWNVTVRRLTATNMNTAVVVWEGVLHDLLFEDLTLTNSTRFAVRYENSSDYRVTFRNVVSTGSGTQGFYSSYGTPPPGVTLSGCSFH